MRKQAENRLNWCMKEGLIASSYECPKCNDQHDVTWSAIKRFLRNRASHAEYCSPIVVVEIQVNLRADAKTMAGSSTYARREIDEHRFVDNTQWGLALSDRSHFPDSLRWRAVGWMEMGLSQADAAMRLNVSRSVE
ncbi:hypothetical protein TNCV_91911 [Trichonephila clavipes]|nr:hypothetical protein TNCV_91911 [Trichonephila clavipes]